MTRDENLTPPEPRDQQPTTGTPGAASPQSPRRESALDRTAREATHARASFESRGACSSRARRARALVVGCLDYYSVTPERGVASCRKFWR